MTGAYNLTDHQLQGCTRRLITLQIYKTEHSVKWSVSANSRHVLTILNIDLCTTQRVEPEKKTTKKKTLCVKCTNINFVVVF